MVLLKQEKAGTMPSIVRSTEVEETFSLCLVHCFIYSRPLSFIMGVMWRKSTCALKVYSLSNNLRIL